ncbi:MAG TPA: urease accessory protein UreD [Usitatibacter sp.]|nr:urease accessory protein UreD [Usitatibacter sp.]
MPPDEGLRTGGWRARLALAFERRGSRTVLAAREHDGPLVVQKALHPEGDAPCHAIVVHPPAGIVGGDELVIEVAARENAGVLLTTPGAGKWYRSAGAWARQRVSIHAAAASRVEWLPQETIVYDGARADIAWEAHLEADARLVAWDIVCLGRVGSGEGFESGRCRLASRLFRDGKASWLERGQVEPDSALRRSPAGLARRAVFGTMIVAAPAIEDEWLAAARQARPREGEGAATRLPGVLVVRYRGDSTGAAREYFTDAWMRLREAVIGTPPAIPRIWHT